MSAQIFVPAGTEEPKIAAGSKVAAAIQSGSMGIVGQLRQNIGNMTAMSVICMVFVWQLRDAAIMAREDRAMFREAVEKVETRNEARSIRAEITHGKAFEKMGTTIERAVSSMEKATTTLERVANKKDE